ncbi:hypothetical protein GOV14_05255 [Candidatus Pacearchaeota archaeon]|nr:hypothetical protein [Candidatus Pacearchaeota archaeon]
MQEKEILKLLKKEDFGFSITELSNKLKIPRNQIRILLAKLEGARKVKHRNVGMAKMYLLVHGGEGNEA